MEVCVSSAKPQGPLGGERSGRSSSAIPLQSAPPNAPPAGGLACAVFRLRVLFLSWGSGIFKYRGCSVCPWGGVGVSLGRVRGWCRSWSGVLLLSVGVGAVPGRGCCCFPSGSVSGSGLFGIPPARCLGSRSGAFLLVFCVLRVFFFAFFLLRVFLFRIFVSCLVLVLSVPARFHPRLRWFGVSAGRLCSAGSLSPCPVFPCRLGFALLSASRLLALGSLRGCAGAWVALGRWVGRSLVPAPRRLGCRSARGVFPSVVSNSLCFRKSF